MAKMTLLDMTQSILSSMGSDQVNSIGDTVESLQVANIIKETYYNMLGRYDLPEHNQFIQLIPSDDDTKPTLMTMPDGVSRIESVEYFDTNPLDGSNITQSTTLHDINLDLQQNAGGWTTTSTTTNTIAIGTQTFTVPAGLSINVGDTAFCYPGSPPTTNTAMSGKVTGYVGTTLTLNITDIFGSGTFSIWTLSQGSRNLFGPGYLQVRMLPIDDFFRMINQFDPQEINVGSYTLTITDNATSAPGDFTIYYKSDRQPSYCTILSNFYILFDSFDQTQDSTLQGSKSRAYAWVVPFFTMEDTFIPNLNEQHFPLFLNDAKSLAFNELKQMPHQKAEDEVARQLVSLQKWKAISGKPSYFDELPSFGRHGSLNWGPIWKR